MGGQSPETDAYLRKILPPDQLVSEGLNEPNLQQTIIIECSDGRRRQVTFLPDSHLVRSSIIIEPILDVHRRPFLI